MTTQHRVLIDEETLVERKHAVALIASVMEVEGSAWSGEGAGADVARLQSARRIAWAQWMAEVGEINESDYPGRIGAGERDGGLT